MFDLGLIQQCASQMDYPVAQAIVKQESGFNPFAIGVNRNAPVKQPQNFNEAVNKAKELLAKGYNIDLGLGQINSSNMRWLGLSVEQAFNPCNNLKAMQTVYLDCLNKSGESGLGTKMQRAFSCYNTGNIKNGFYNGYVNKVTQHFNSFFSREVNGKSLGGVPPISSSNDLAVYATALNQDQPLGENNVVNNGEEIEKEIPMKVKNSWDVFSDF